MKQPSQNILSTDRYEAHIFVRTCSDNDMSELRDAFRTHGFGLSDREKTNPQGERKLIATRTGGNKRALESQMRLAALAARQLGFNVYRIRLEEGLIDEVWKSSSNNRT